MTFHKINEDPFYDEDGNCVDEDFYYDLDDEGNWVEVKEQNQGEEVSYSPYDTLNS
jgi:hypothetical protein